MAVLQDIYCSTEPLAGQLAARRTPRAPCKG